METITKPCPACGDPFTAEHDKMVYCSLDCYVDHAQPPAAAPALKQGDMDRLYEIHDAMVEMLAEANEIVQQSATATVYSQARAYWIAQMEIALNNEHDYLGHASCSMMDTIEAMEGLGASPDED